jgi:hypothetical protein
MIDRIRVLLLVLCFQLVAQAQIDELITRYAGENANGYIEPLITGFGANLNSGLYRSAKIPVMGLHLNIGITIMAARFSDSQRKFIASTTGYFYPYQQVEAPTIIGDPTGTSAVSPQGGEYVFPGGYDMKSFMIGTPSLTIGSVFGTEATLRYIETNLSEEIGVISLFGIGLRHSVNQYFPTLPLDMAAGIFYHRFNISNIVNSKVYCVHAEVGKSLYILDVYGGLAYESNQASVEYAFDSGIKTTNISVMVTGKNKFRVTAGLGFNFTLFHINLDYNLGHQNVVNASVSLGL